MLQYTKPDTVHVSNLDLESCASIIATRGRMSREYIHIFILGASVYRSVAKMRQMQRTANNQEHSKHSSPSTERIPTKLRPTCIKYRKIRADGR